MNARNVASMAIRLSVAFNVIGLSGSFHRQTVVTFCYIKTQSVDLSCFNCAVLNIFIGENGFGSSE